jgi:hypothetical protein
LRDSHGRARERTSVVVTGVVVLSNDADGRLLGCWVVSNGTFLCDNLHLSTRHLQARRVARLRIAFVVALIGSGDLVEALGEENEERSNHGSPCSWYEYDNNRSGDALTFTTTLY